MSLWDKTRKGQLVGTFCVEWWNERKKCDYCCTEEEAEKRIAELKKDGITAKITDRPKWVWDDKV